MRKILTEEEKRKKERRNQLIIGIILVILMFSSVFGIAIYSFGKEKDSLAPEKSVEYKGYQFINQNGLWNLQFTPKFQNTTTYEFSFFYNPLEVRYIDTNLNNSFENYLGKDLIIYSEYISANNEISKNLEHIVKEIKIMNNLSSINCSENSIIIQTSIQANITQSNRCIYIKGNPEEILELTDIILFKIIGIE